MTLKDLKEAQKELFQAAKTIELLYEMADKNCSLSVDSSIMFSLKNNEGKTISRCNSPYVALKIAKMQGWKP